MQKYSLVNCISIQNHSNKAMKIRDNLLKQLIHNKSHFWHYKSAFSTWKLFLKGFKRQNDNYEWTKLNEELSLEKEKLADREAMIKKLIRENMSLAYKVSNAKIKTKDFIKLADNVYSKSDKENQILVKKKIVK